MQIGSTEALKAQMEKCIVSDCKDCPYTDAQICDTAMTKDALEYIESLEERIAIMQESMEALEKRNDAIKLKKIEGCTDSISRAECPTCGEVIDIIHNRKFCGECGQAVKWW